MTSVCYQNSKTIGLVVPGFWKRGGHERGIQSRKEKDVIMYIALLRVLNAILKNLSGEGMDLVHP